jgi:MEMO1 family protein
MIKKRGALLLILCALPGIVMTRTVKKGHLPAGWYPRGRKALEAKLNELDVEVEKKYHTDIPGVRACIVPHAGLRYSGSVVASCFKLIDRTKVKRIILLAPSHHLPFAGIALPKYTSYKITNGVISVDTKSIAQLGLSKSFQAQKRLLRDPHDLDHSLEIEFPLIARYFPLTPIVPLLVGYLDKQQLVQAATELENIIDANTLVVASSDFTHYGPRFDYMPFEKKDRQQDRIRQLDSVLMQPLFNLNSDTFLVTLKKKDATVCGKYPIALLLALLEKKVLKNLEPYLVSYATSQNKDAKDPTHSVSYTGIVFGAPDEGVLPLLTLYEKNELLRLARAAIENKLTPQKEPELSRPVLSPVLQEPYGAFITVYDKNHDLRGCIGSIVTQEPLYKTVEQRAVSAAFEDSRFRPLKKKELSDITLQLSVLSKPYPIKSYKDIKLGQHGIILRNGTRTAVFLPKVAVEQGWTLAQTLEQLSLKARLSKQAWKNKKTKYQVFESLDFGEQK